MKSLTSLDVYATHYHYSRSPSIMAKTRSQTLLSTVSNATVPTPSIKQLRAAAKRAKDSAKVKNEERHRNCFAARKAEAEAAHAQYIGSMRYLGTKLFS